MTTSKCGQALTNVSSQPSFSAPDEPKVAPLKLRLRSSTGSSFPNVEVVHAERRAAKKQMLLVGKENVFCTLQRGGQGAGTVDR